jgi:hypothetical protein
MGDHDPGRAQVAERGLTPAAVGALIPLMGSVGFEELGLVKALLKRFFSAGPWTAMDAAALADAVGPPPPSVEGDVDVIRHRLDAALELVAGWVDGRFVLDVEVADAPPPAEPTARTVVDLAATFDSGVVPEPTPNPRTIRFATGRRRVDASVAFRRGEDVDDDRIAAIFAVDDAVVDVLVAADFVAVSVSRPARWPDLLAPVLAAVDAGFGGAGGPAPDEDAVPGPDVRGVSAPGGGRDTGAARPGRRTRLDRAWAELGRLDARRPDDLRALLDAAKEPDGARRQVAAQLLDAAPEDVAVGAWSAMLDDPSRAVRRTVVDAAASAGHAATRTLLERATTDPDAWVRWKALHGLVDLGIGSSHHVLDALADDPDFRVRLEAENARRD